MSTLAEIQKAIEKLPAKEKHALSAWITSQSEDQVSEREEAALLASLDRAAEQLDSGKGVPLEAVRGMVGKWASK